MSYFRIQMHPGWPEHSVIFAKEGLKCMNAIGLDFGSVEDRLKNLPFDQWNNDDFNKTLNKWAQDAMDEAIKNNQPITNEQAINKNRKFIGCMRYFAHPSTGDVFLVHGGATPVALVKVVGPYYSVPLRVVD
jgi:hypothetical protein